MRETTQIYDAQSSRADTYELLIDELRDITNIGLLMVRLGSDLDMAIAIGIGRMMADKAEKTEKLACEIYQSE